MKKIDLDFNKPAGRGATEMAIKTLSQGGFDIVGRREKIAALIAELDTGLDFIKKSNEEYAAGTARLAAAHEEFKEALKAKPRKKWGLFG